MRHRLVVAGLVAVAVLALSLHFQERQAAATPEPLPEERTELVADAGQIAQPDGRKHTLRISVNEVGAPVSGARVVASLKVASSSSRSPTWIDRADQRTDARGQIFLQARAGLWFVLVRKEGFADAFQDVLVEAQDEVTSVTVALERGFGLSGVALDPDGHSLAPAQIKAIPLGEQLTKRRSAPEGERNVAVEMNGTFTLIGLSRGWWRVEGESEGFGRSQARVISVPTTELLELVFRPSGFIEGFVVTKGGTPAPHATVSVVGENDTTSIDTSETGAFSVERPPGAYRLSAHLGDLVGSTTALTFVRARATATARITLEGKGATLRGQVLRDDGASVAGATIIVRPTLQEGLVAEDRTDEDGRWELAGLAPGTFDVEASFAGLSPAVETGFNLVDGAIVDTRLTLARLGSVEGMVVTADGKPVAAQVVLRGKYDPFPQRQLVAGTDGHFSFSNVPSGDVLVRASLGVEDSGATAAASVRAGTTTEVSLALPARYELRVELDRTACKAIEAVMVSAFEPDASHAAIETLVPSSAQHVVLKLREGAWTIRAAMRAPAACFGLADVDIGAGVLSRSRSIRLVPAPPMMQLTVFESTQDPAPGAQVTVVSKDGSQLRAETDLDGRVLLALKREMVASISAVKNGRSARLAGATITGARVSLTLSPAAHLRVHIVGHQMMTRVLAVEINGESLPVEAVAVEAVVYLAEVPEGALDVRASNADDSRFGASTITTQAGETTEVTVTLKGIGSLLGTAKLPSTAQGQARVAITSSLGTRIEQLEPSGSFDLGPMPEGHYTLEIRCSGCTWAPRSVQVGSSQETRVDFQ